MADSTRSRRGPQLSKREDTRRESKLRDKLAGKSYLLGGVYLPVKGTRLLLTLVVLSLAPRQLALSQASPSAAALLDEGYALRERGEDDQALAKFQEAYRLSPEPRALAQIALAEQALGRWLEAEQHLQGALADSRDPWIAQRRQLLVQSLHAIEAELGALEIRCNVAGATVELAGRAVGTTPLTGPMRAAASVLHVTLAAEGYFPVTQTVTIHPGQLSRAEFVLPARPAQAASTMAGVDAAGLEPEKSARHDDTVRRKRWLWAGLGGALTAVVVTVLAVSLANREPQEYENHGNTGAAIVVTAAGSVMQP